MSDVGLFVGDRYYRSQFANGLSSYLVFQKDGTTYADPLFAGGVPYTGSTVITDAATALTAGGAIMIRNGVYSHSSPVSIANPAIRLYGENKTKTILRASGNTNLLNVTGDYCHIENLSLDTASAQTGGIGLNVSGDFFTADHLRIGTVENRQHFYQGLSLSSKYSVLRDITVNNAQNYAVKLAGAKNDVRLSDFVVDNWGLDIFTNNPVGILLEDTTGAFLSRVTVGHCDPGMKIAPGNGQTVFESFFDSLNLDTNWGAGLVIAPTGTGLVHNIQFENLWASTNVQKAAAAEQASVRIQGVKTMKWTGGNVGNNPWEGVIIDSSAESEIDIDNVTIHDNNQGNHTGALGTFGSAKTPGIYLNGASIQLSMRGGSLDNPGHGATIGNQGGIYVTSAGKVVCSKVRLLKNVPASGPYGSSIGAGIVFMDDCPGYNPSVYTTTAGASIWTGTNDSPTKEVWVLDNLNGGTVSAISYQGVAGYPTTVKAYPFLLDLGESITVTWATTAPTFRRFPISSGL